jgi:hypothetical protein
MGPASGRGRASPASRPGLQELDERVADDGDAEGS